MTQERQISLAPWIEAAFKQRAVSEAYATHQTLWKGCFALLI